jgi:hypothetical protein
MQIGFSTGAVALGDFHLAMERLRPLDLDAIELSALRSLELGPLLSALPTLDLAAYSYVALHAPSDIRADNEREVVDSIGQVAAEFNAIIVHPDTMLDESLWLQLDEAICFENMDKRKCTGRTADELDLLFGKFPKAGLCLDLGHVWQVDRTMTEAMQILRRFGHRVRQLHVSEVNTQSKHVPLTVATVTAFRRVFDLLPDVPWILEAIVAPDQIGREVRYVRESFSLPISLITD